RRIAQRRGSIVIKINHSVFLYLLILIVLMLLIVIVIVVRTSSSSARPAVAPYLYSLAKLIACCGWFVVSFRNDSQLFLFVIHQRIGRHALDQKNVATNCRSGTDDRLAPQNR